MQKAKSCKTAVVDDPRKIIADIETFVDTNLVKCCKGYLQFHANGIMPKSGAFTVLVSMCCKLPGVHAQEFAQSRVAIHAALAVIENAGE